MAPTLLKLHIVRLNIFEKHSQKINNEKEVNILIASTRQWNPGDEFIAMGVRNLIKAVLKNRKINWILYDRNPDLFLDGFSKPIHRPQIWTNAFNNGPATCIDLALVAGTPEWFGLPMIKFYKAIKQSDIPLILLGVGYIDKGISFSHDELYCFKKLLKLAIVRDEYASRALKEIGVRHEVLPCPALFTTAVSITRKKRKRQHRRIAFVIQTNRTINQSIPEELVHASIWEVKRLREHGFKVDVICHYIDEFAEFSRSLAPIRYSYDSSDYPSIFADYDLVISTRLHGAIIANSLGKPAILLNADSRSTGAAKLFPFIHVTAPNDLLSQVDKVVNLPIHKLMKWKSKIKAQYIKFLQVALKGQKK